MSATTTDIFADLERLRLASFPVRTPTVNTPIVPKVSAKPRVKKIVGEFLKGPIPLPWLTVAAKLCGKAPLAVALALWFEAGRRKSKEVKLTTAILKRFAVNRKAKYRALASLEKAGLVRVYREPRRNPVVLILDSPGETKKADVGQSAADGLTSLPDQQQASDDAKLEEHERC